MIHKMLISAFATGLAMTIPLCLMFLQRGAGGAQENSWDKAFYHVLLLSGVAVVYWSVSLMHYMDLKKCNARTAVEKFSVLMYPMTFLVVLSIVLVGLFSLSDEYVRQHDIMPDAPASLIPWARFGVSTIEVFPHVFFPVGVVMYAFWGAFLYNLYNFIRRIIDGDFVPRVVIMAGIRIVLAIFASLLLYFVFFREGSESSAEGVMPSGLLIVTSFLAGFYPRQTMKMIVTWIAGRLSQLFPAIGKYIYTPLTVIQGITLEIEDRLNEEGVDSIQALATADASTVCRILTRRFWIGSTRRSSPCTLWMRRSLRRSPGWGYGPIAACWSIGRRRERLLPYWRERIRARFRGSDSNTSFCMASFRTWRSRRYRPVPPLKCRPM